MGLVRQDKRKGPDMQSYKEIEQRLDTLTPFKGNSMSGVWHGNTFIVYSYKTPIGYSSLSGFAIEERKYSVTTSRHQNLLRRVWGPKAKGQN
jgi:hypothetical protein